MQKHTLKCVCARAKFLVYFFGSTILKLESLRMCVSECRVNVLLNSFLARGDFYHLLITFANSLDPDQERQNFSPDLDPNCLTL